MTKKLAIIIDREPHSSGDYEVDRYAFSYLGSDAGLDDDQCQIIVEVSVDGDARITSCNQFEDKPMSITKVLPEMSAQDMVFDSGVVRRERCFRLHYKCRACGEVETRIIAAVAANTEEVVEKLLSEKTTTFWVRMLPQTQGHVCRSHLPEGFKDCSDHQYNLGRGLADLAYVEEIKQ